MSYKYNFFAKDFRLPKKSIRYSSSRNYMLYLHLLSRPTIGYEDFINYGFATPLLKIKNINNREAFTLKEITPKLYSITINK